MNKDEDALIFLGEQAEGGAHANAARPWYVLVVDDDVDVHKVTRLVFKHFLVCERPIEIVSAYSGQEALHLLNNHASELPDLVLMDVVMDSPTDGIDTVHRIRSELNLREVPYVIMRTGQAGTSFELHDLEEDVDIDCVMQKSLLSSESLRIAVSIGLTKGRSRHRSGIDQAKAPDI